ncbi:MAG: CoA transferase [Chloroflexi bacterium]|nr:CoA transferase [Chloroflexota bacterium]
MTGQALGKFKILDMSRVQAGPSCGQLLAWLGADVIKLEDTAGGDNTRWEQAHQDGVDSVYFTIFNNNKRAITLNLKDDKGRELFTKLVQWADVVLENFSKGVMERLGFGYEKLREINPRVVHASIKGFGEYGRWSGFKSFELAAQASSGAIAANGYPDRPPMATPVGVGDSGTGLHTAIGILAALHQRNDTGEGQHVEVSMQDGIVNLMRYRLIRSISVGGPNVRTGYKGANGIPSVYKCAPGGSDDYIMIHNRGQAFETLMIAIGREDILEDERFITDETREQHPDEVEELINSWTSQRDKFEAFEHLAPFGIWCGAVVTPEEVLTNEHLIAREMVVNVPDSVRGDYQMIGCPIKLEKSPVIVKSAPHYSQHTEEILTELLGVTEEELPELRQRGVIV